MVHEMKFPKAQSRQADFLLFFFFFFVSFIRRATIPQQLPTTVMFKSSHPGCVPPVCLFAVASQTEIFESAVSQANYKQTE